MGTRSLYVAIPKFGAYSREWIAALQRLELEPELAIVSVDACMRDDPATALLRLRVRPERTWDLSTLVVWAFNEGLQLIDPKTLPAPHRDAFYAHYLPQFKLRVRDFVKPAAALKALERTLKQPERFAEGTINTPRSEVQRSKKARIEWRAPRIQVVDRTKEGRGHGTRTASGVIGDREAFYKTGTIV